MNRILVPYDFSEASDHALNFAVQVGGKSSASEVMLYNVIEHPSESRLKTMGATPVDPMQNVYMTSLIELTEKKLTERINKCEDCGVKITYRIHLGNPFISLNEEVAKQDVDLVIMGTCGSSGLDELFIGSNAEKIVRTAKAPVITLKSAAPITDIKNLVFASNFYQLKKEFVSKVLELQKTFNAKLRIVKINTPANFTTTRHDMEQMKAFVKDNKIENYTIDIYNYTNEEDGIVYFAQDCKADMIALGTNKRTGFKHFLTGSIAEDVVNEANLPVWTFQLD